jgi:Dos2-interacting transcription regulator of RNA-Pol-II
MIQAGEGEKDPRNLLLIFSTTDTILNMLSVDHLREDIFESLAVYFPIGKAMQLQEHEILAIVILVKFLLQSVYFPIGKSKLMQCGCKSTRF